MNGHYDMLLRAVVNVLDNAIKYSPPGSEVTVRLACWGELAGICVIDQGIGIPEHALPRLFELFYQVDEQRRDGVGLGRPSSRPCCKRMAAVSRLNPGAGWAVNSNCKRQG